ncbi:MAG: hypothetical protein KA144_14650 [Xanthomonadaceae bacterium]|nr:hypothetical protein [Xanthomonadaceae bacterium]
METSAVQALKLALVSTLGLSRDALHVYVGLTVFLVVAIVRRKRSWILLSWLAVVAVAVFGEALDAVDDLRSIGRWRVGASVHDIVNTLFWPTALSFLARFDRRFRAPGPDDAR